MRSLLILLLAILCSCSSNNSSLNIIPAPERVWMHSGDYTLLDGAEIVADDSLNIVCNYLIKEMSYLGIQLSKSRDGVGDIYLDCTNSAITNPEAYRINITGANIEMWGTTINGVRYAVETLLQLAKSDKILKRSHIIFPRVEIVDRPRFSYRGLHLDVSRHFFDVNEVKSILRHMSRYKLNTFHWHLTNNNGWRIEIKKYPLLTSVGGWRKLDTNDRKCQQLSVQTGDRMYNLPEKHLRIVNGDTLYGGFYTQRDIIDVVSYANSLGIEVIPEISMPSHLGAAIRAYPNLSCSSDSKSVFCMGNPQTKEFITNVFNEISHLFPCKYIHVGSDMVDTSHWAKCKLCIDLLHREGLYDFKKVHSRFIDNMTIHFNNINKVLIGWDDIVHERLPKDAHIMWWRNWDESSIRIATILGNKVVVCPTSMLYFDSFEQENTLIDLYNYDPLQGSLLSEVQKKNIIGIQGNLWTANVPTIECAEYHYFPRILALSELGWSMENSHNWESFTTRLQSECEYLDSHNINYRIPSITGFHTVNSFIESTSVKAKTILPNIKIRYTTDGSIPTLSSPIIDDSIMVNESTSFKFRGFRPDNSGGEVFTALFVKETPSAPLDVNSTREGIFCKHYEFHGQDCQKISSSKFVSNYVVDSISIPNLIQGWLGLEFEGYFEASKSGVYTFRLTSDDGSMLHINDKVLINNNGAHSPTTLTSQIALHKGTHKIKIHYFDKNDGGFIRLQWIQPQESFFSTMKSFKY